MNEIIQKYGIVINIVNSINEELNKLNNQGTQSPGRLNKIRGLFNIMPKIGAGDNKNERNANCCFSVAGLLWGLYVTYNSVAVLDDVKRYLTLGVGFLYID